MSNEPIDVLAVIGVARVYAAQSGEGFMADNLRRCHLAVAGLIEAARDIYGDFDDEHPVCGSDCPTCRIRAALARATPPSPPSEPDGVQRYAWSTRGWEPDPRGPVVQYADVAGRLAAPSPTGHCRDAVAMAIQEALTEYADRTEGAIALMPDALADALADAAIDAARAAGPAYPAMPPLPTYEPPRLVSSDRIVLDAAPDGEVSDGTVRDALAARYKGGWGANEEVLMREELRARIRTRDEVLAVMDRDRAVDEAQFWSYVRRCINDDLTAAYESDHQGCIATAKKHLAEVDRIAAPKPAEAGVGEDEVQAVVAEMWDEIRHTGIATSDQLQTWARRLAPVALSSEEVAALEQCERDIDDPVFNLTGRSQFKRVFAALRRLTTNEPKGD